MTWFSREEYLKILLSASSEKEIRGILIHDLRNRAVSAFMNLELLTEDFDDMDKAEIIQSLLEAKSCVRDIIETLAAVDDYARITNNQSPTTKNEKP